MDIRGYISEMREIQHNLLDLLDNENNPDNRYQNFITLLNSKNIQGDKHKLKSFLYLLVQVANNYGRGPIFLIKIIKILDQFKSQISQYYSKHEIFNIFNSNKRLLLYIFDEQIIPVDNFIAKKISEYGSKFISMEYNAYFYPEISPFLSEYEKESISRRIPPNLKELRKSGEKIQDIFLLIEADSINEFISQFRPESSGTYNYSPNFIFETNSFLLSNPYCEYIEYAAFCGSIQIFNYLSEKIERNKFEKTILQYAIHSKNFDFINYIISNFSDINSRKKCFLESIGLFNKELSLLINKDVKYENEMDIQISALKGYNFDFIHDYSIHKFTFPYLCEYHHYILANSILNNRFVDVNQTTIFAYFVFIQFFFITF